MPCGIWFIFLTCLFIGSDQTAHLSGNRAFCGRLYCSQVFVGPLARKSLKRAFIVLACSTVISAVTAIFMPENLILFGVLSLIGTGMLITVPFEKVFRKISPYTGLIVCIILFALTRNIAHGRLDIFGFNFIELPEWLYANSLTAYLGFPSANFSSQDYVPLMPWIFLYWTGYLIYLIFERKDLLKHLSAFRLKPLEWLGRHSLEIYMIHQPLIYGVLFVVFKII